MNLIEFYSDCQEFLESLFKDLDDFGIKIEDHWDIDHICYRVETGEKYFENKRAFLSFSTLLSETEVNGRLISIFKMQKPIFFNGYKIDLIELPAPKKGKIVKEGFEHIEVVCDLPIEVLEDRYKHLDINSNGLNKYFNRELAVALRGKSIKFHHLSLKSVLNLEKNQKVWGAIQESKILEYFSDKNPLIAGTFPLSVHNEQSDVDLLMNAEDLENLKERLSKCYGGLQGYRTNEFTSENELTLLVQFVYKGVPFEIFAQNRPTPSQRAYQHFLIEEKILKYTNEEFTQKIIDLKKIGIKTEVAFGTTLELKGDFYHELLLLQKTPMSKLRNLLSSKEPLFK